MEPSLLWSDTPLDSIEFLIVLPPPQLLLLGLNLRHCDYSTTELHQGLIIYNNYRAGWIKIVSCQFVHPKTGP